MKSTQRVKCTNRLRKVNLIVVCTFVFRERRGKKMAENLWEGDGREKMGRKMRERKRRKKMNH